MKYDENFANECLAAHNEYRRKHGVAPLTLDVALCNLAQEWAEKLAKTDKMEHRPKNKYGENIYNYWNSDKSKPTPNQAVDSWYKEIEKYKFGTNESQKGTGHFTQVVWKTTKCVGIGYAQSSKGTTYVVADYDPPGNFVGEYDANVLKASS